jgi:aldehyde:ferredoxin oxidoreductase
MDRAWEIRCLGCPVRCSNINRLKKGRAGIEIDGPEYETIYAFGGLCMIPTIEDIIRINDLCDRLGMDTISTGNIVG